MTATVCLNSVYGSTEYLARDVVKGTPMPIFVRNIVRVSSSVQGRCRVLGPGSGPGRTWTTTRPQGHLNMSWIHVVHVDRHGWVVDRLRLA